MRVLQEYDEVDAGQNALIFALGAAGGLAIGMALSRWSAPRPAVRRLGSELRDRARTVARSMRPARMRRMAIDQDELTGLEDLVLDAFLTDEILSERGVDVGAISRGIVELSGAVWNQTEADRAVRVASAVAGVRTVVNRLEVEEETRRKGLDAAGSSTLLRRTGRTGGMGRHRQGMSTEPDRPDESQHISERALATADRDQWVNEGFAHTNSKESERPEVQQTPWKVNFEEGELDNQDPHAESLHESGAEVDRND